ncbi:MAG: hypothetical protein ACTSWJ_11015 [Candidatus Heimdallarchaeaceae archaeon]
MTRILNIGAGKQEPLNLNLLDSYFLLNLDKMYFNSVSPECFEDNMIKWNGSTNDIMNMNWDIPDFLERTVIEFDLITIYRFLEHIAMTDILYFIYLISTVTKPGSIVEVIVPDYTILAKMLLEEDINNENYEANNIMITTEMLNEPNDPHASIWTPSRAKYYWELEGRFYVDEESIQKSFLFDGRDIYLRFSAKRI